MVQIWRVEKLGLQLNGDLELKNILIKDHHNDTLIAVTELNSSILNFAKLNDNKLLFGDIDLYGLRFISKPIGVRKIQIWIFSWKVLKIIRKRNHQHHLNYLQTISLFQFSFFTPYR